MACWLHVCDYGDGKLMNGQKLTCPECGHDHFYITYDFTEMVVRAFCVQCERTMVQASGVPYQDD